MKTRLSAKQCKPHIDPPSIDGIRYMVILEMLSQQDYSTQNLLREIRERSGGRIFISWADIWRAFLHLTASGMAENYETPDSCADLYTITASGREYLGRLKEQYISMVESIATVLGGE